MSTLQEANNSATLIMNEFHQQLSAMAYRWSDEKEYEDFNDYIDGVKTRMHLIVKDLKITNYHFVKLTKAFTMVYMLGTIKVVVKVGKRKITMTLEEV